MSINYRGRVLQRGLPVLLAVFLLAGCARKNELAGTWQGKITLPQTGKSLSDQRFSLMQKGETVHGTMLFASQGRGLPLTGTFIRGKLVLTSPQKDGLAVSISGTLDGAHRISGSAVLDYDTPQLGKKQDQALLELIR
jgi:hypothetical protein